MAAVALLAPAGCSVGGDEEPKPASGAPRAIAATVERLERAVAAGDYAEVCDELFTARARRRAGGAECAAQVRSAAEGVRSPTIDIQGIDVKGDRARVRVSTKARGQERLTDTLDLRREGERWLVEALG
jgi:Putative lumazine-binding